MRPHRLGVVSPFVLVVLTGVLLVASALGALTFLESRLELVESSTAGLLELTASQAARLDSRMARTAGRTEGLASSLEVLDRLDEAQLLALLRRNLVESPDVFGTAAAFAPYAFDPGRRLYAPYLYRDATGIAQRDLGAPTYDYPVWDWYLVPALLGRSVWSEPYFDEGGGGVLMTTYSAPAIVDGEVRAVVTADLSLAYLTAEVRQLEVGSGGWAFVLSSRGTFLAAPRTELIMKEAFFSPAAGPGGP